MDEEAASGAEVSLDQNVTQIKGQRSDALLLLLRRRPDSRGEG